MKYSARLFLQVKQPVQKETIVLMQGVVQGLNNHYKLFYAYDSALFMQINKQRYASEKLLETMNFSDSKELIGITELHLIQELLLDLVEARAALEK